MSDKPKKPADHLMEQYKTLKPLAGLIGIFSKDAGASIKDLSSSVDDFRKLQRTMDEFKSRFGPIGWAAFDSISSTHVIDATTAETIEEAELILTDYLLKGSELEFLGYKFNSDKYGSWKELYDRAAERVLAEDYLSAVPLIFMMIDGICLKFFQRHPFSGAADEEVFDTYTSGPDALEKAYALLGSTRRKINDDPISIPYRHGIIHGVDTNYGHRTVTAKAINILRATLDYVQASESEEARIEDAVKEQTPTKWGDVFATIKRTGELNKAMEAWEARPPVKNETLAQNGTAHSFGDNSPEAKAADNLDAIIAKNYGALASASIIWTEGSLGKKAGRMRADFADLEITEWTITGYTDTASAATNVEALIKGTRLGEAIAGVGIVRCIYQNSETDSPLARGMDGGEWFVMPNIASQLWQMT